MQFLKVTFHLKLLQNIGYIFHVVQYIFVAYLTLIICIIPPTPPLLCYLPLHSGFFVNFLDTIYSGNFQMLCLISQAFLPILLDEHSTRIDFRTLSRALYCVWLSKKKKRIQVPYRKGTCQHQCWLYFIWESPEILSATLDQFLQWCSSTFSICWKWQ